ncbi:MAG: single-stranded DNA-binding protein [bacterium]
MLNRIILIGRLTRDPELRYTQSGVAVASFTLAVNRNFKNAQGEIEADFIDIVVWRNQAENCANYLGKGRLVAVEGRLQVRTYETQEGQKRKVAEVVADSVRFLEKKNTANAGGSSAEMGEFLDDDIPF